MIRLERGERSEGVMRGVAWLAALGWILVVEGPGDRLWAQGYPPGEAAERMWVAEGLEVKTFAAEPMVRQPVAIEFDDRGRLWVIQYLQYPNPAGLKRVRVDRYSRTVYDRVPEPPPHGPRGDDRITILEDVDGDGRADRACDFVAGLNLASGLSFGHGGVYVIQAPYLLFYPDRNRDDVPDGDPEVLLSGFGMEDAHSVANSLTWGPDGWLYGLQGSTVTANIRGIEFQQGIWRYHPLTRRFELFAEGGGNMWGLDFDRRGQLFASTNVGGSVMLHGVQGGYFWKQFGKHGPLHHPYVFGYFEHVQHAGVVGGHVSVGGLFYDADSWPDSWRGRYLAADLLGHAIRGHEVEPMGSTVRARQVGDVLRANDTWFAPSDLTLGPDGALYIADWHDARTAHPDPDADWDRSNGRIFALRRRGDRSLAPPDLGLCSERELVDLLDHGNVWYRRKARRLLTERPGGESSERLREQAVREEGVRALEALWVVHGRGELTDELMERLLNHRDPEIRLWLVRFAGDDQAVSERIAGRLVELAAGEPQVSVRAQLASTARRLDPATGLEIAERLVLRDEDADDPHLPLLIWWAIEHHALVDPAETLRRFANARVWESRLARSAILERLLRRLALEGSAEGDAACVRLLESAPSPQARLPLLHALDESLRGRSAIAPELAGWLIARYQEDPTELVLCRLAARLGEVSARARCRRDAADPVLPEGWRKAMIGLLGELGGQPEREVLLRLTMGDESLAVRLAAVDALARSQDETVATALVAAYPGQVEPWRARVRGLLLGRVGWARVFLDAVDRGQVPAAELSLAELSRFPALLDPALAPLVRKHWGSTRGPTSEERLAEVRRLSNDLRAGSGDWDRGRTLFLKHCASCHRLHGEGEAIGPDLTFANRQDRDFLLLSLVDPSGMVRKEYRLQLLETQDGRVLSGLITAQTEDAVTLHDANGNRTQVSRAEIVEVREAEESLMPESLYRGLSPQDLRDLFRYLQDDHPTNPGDHP